MKKALFSLWIIVFVVGCSQFKKREVARPHDAPVKAPVSGTKEGVDGDFQDLPAQISNQAAKRVGLILGGGGARTLAYAGLIKSFKKNKITISHVAATEWATLVAASFALSGEVHDMDWKLYKLESLNLKFEKGFLGFGGGQSLNAFNKYLSDNFSGSRMESGKVSFSCATRSLGANQSVILSRGKAVDVLRHCLATPPFFKSYSRAASPASLLKLAQSLRKQGAEIIVYVDALDSSVLKEPLIRESQLLRFSWGQILESHDLAQEFIKNSYRLNLSRYSIFDFSRRKALEQEGEFQGDKIAQKLIEVYGL